MALLVGVVAVLALTRGAGTSGHSMSGTIRLDVGLEELENCDAGGMSKLGQMIKGRTFACPEGPGGGLSDFYDGAPVLIKDADGTTIAKGEMADGTLRKAIYLDLSWSADAVPDVDIYEITVGDRTGLTVTREELEKQDWTVDMHLR